MEQMLAVFASRLIFAFGIFCLSVLLMVISPPLGIIVGLLISIIALIGVFKPIPKLGLTSKSYSFALFVFDGILVTFLSLATFALVSGGNSMTSETRPVDLVVPDGMSDEIVVDGEVDEILIDPNTSTE